MFEYFSPSLQPAPSSAGEWGPPASAPGERPTLQQTDKPAAAAALARGSGCDV